MKAFCRPQANCYLKDVGGKEKGGVVEKLRKDQCSVFLSIPSCIGLSKLGFSVVNCRILVEHL